MARKISFIISSLAFIANGLQGTIPADKFKTGTLIDYTNTYTSPWFKEMIQAVWGLKSNVITTHTYPISPYTYTNNPLCNFYGAQTTDMYYMCKLKPTSLSSGDATAVYRLLRPSATVWSNGNLCYCGESPEVSGTNMFQRVIVYGDVTPTTFSPTKSYIAKATGWNANSGPILTDATSQTMNQPNLFKLSIAQLLSSGITPMTSNCYFGHARTPERWCVQQVGRCSTCNSTGKITCPATTLVTCTSCAGYGYYRFTCTYCNGTGFYELDVMFMKIKIACPYCNNGYGWYSCSGCRSSSTRGKVSCSSCSGRGYYVCSLCGGTYSGGRCVEWKICPDCGGSGDGWLFGDCPYCSRPVCPNRDDVTDSTYYGPSNRIGKYGWWITCTRCGGSGKSGNCSYCSATGKVNCSSCSGSGYSYCTTCNKNNTSSNKGKVSVTCSLCNGQGQRTCTACSGNSLDEEGIRLRNNSSVLQHYSVPIHELSCQIRVGTNPGTSSNPGWMFFSHSGPSYQYTSGGWLVQYCKEYLLHRPSGTTINFENHYTVWNTGYYSDPAIDPIYDRENLSKIYSRLCFDSASNAHVVMNRIKTLGTPGYTWGFCEPYFVYLKMNSSGSVLTHDIITDGSGSTRDKLYYACDRDLCLVTVNGITYPTVLTVRNSRNLHPGWNGKTQPYDVVLMSRSTNGSWIIGDKSCCLYDADDTYGTYGVKYPSDPLTWTFRFQQYSNYLIFAICKPPFLSLRYSLCAVDNDAVRLFTQCSYPRFISDCSRIISMDIKDNHLWITYMSANCRKYQYCYIDLTKLL